MGILNLFPTLGGNDTKKYCPGDRFGQPPGEMSSIRSKLHYHVEDHVVRSLVGAVR